MKEINNREEVITHLNSSCKNYCKISYSFELIDSDKVLFTEKVLSYSPKSKVLSYNEMMDFLISGIDKVYYEDQQKAINTMKNRVNKWRALIWNG